MSTVASSNTDLSLNADGSGNGIKFKSNGSEVASINSSGTLTASAFSGALPSGSVCGWQHVRYDVSAAQAMTTTYADVLGSDISYTPTTNASYVYYQYTFLLSSNSSVAADCHLSGKILLDGSVETETTHHFSMDATTDSVSSLVTVNHVVDCSAASWTGAKTIKYQAREYGTGNESQLHETVYHDGAVAAVLHRPIMIIYSVM